MARPVREVGRRAALLAPFAACLAGCDPGRGAARSVVAGGFVAVALGVVLVRVLAALHDGGRPERRTFDRRPHLAAMGGAAILAFGAVASSDSGDGGSLVLLGSWLAVAIYLPLLAVVWRVYRVKSPRDADAKAWVIAALVLYLPPALELTETWRGGVIVTLGLLTLTGWGSVSAVVVGAVFFEAVIQRLLRLGEASPPESGKRSGKRSQP